MLNAIKYKKKMTIKELANFLSVSNVTIHNWENNDNWPSWALKKCGVEFEY
jgi:DNA-binding XRE family transcriptional regulator